jgi:hypothetical protein
MIQLAPKLMEMDETWNPRETGRWRVSSIDQLDNPEYFHSACLLFVKD